MRSIAYYLGILALACVLHTPFAFAAQDKAEAKREEAEKKEAQAEDESERDNFESKTQTTFLGKLELEPLDEEATTPPKTYGSFSVAKGSTYPIKLQDPQLYKVLKAYNGKNISVLAKLRNQGKYLVIVGLVTPEATPKGVGKRGGF